MHLSGQLADWSISDLLQIMAVTKKTGSLDIEGERRGRIHFREGAVTGAELKGANGSYVGSDRGGVADVLYVLSLLVDGPFSVGPADGPSAPGWSIEDVLADVDALKSLEREVVDAGLFEASGVRLISEISAPIEINPEDWNVLVSLVQPFTFTHLETKLGRGGAVRVFHALHRLGVADTITGDEDESDWLDRVADEIAPESADPTWLEHVDTSEEESPQSEDSQKEASQTKAAEPEPSELQPDDSQPGKQEPSESVSKEPAVAKSQPHSRAKGEQAKQDVRGVSAPASTMLTDSVYDEIRRLRSKVAEK